MSTNARGQTTLAGAPVTRAAIEGLLMQVNDVRPVANAVARAQLVSNLAAAGVGPSPAAPLFVRRADAPLGSELEVTADGTTWRTYDARASTRQWTAVTNVSGWAAHPDVGPLQVTRDGDWVTAQGGLARSGGALSFDFVGITVATLPPQFLPKREKEFPCVSNLSSLGWRIMPAGDMRIRAHGGAPVAGTGSYVILDGIRWEARDA